MDNTDSSLYKTDCIIHMKMDIYCCISNLSFNYATTEKLDTSCRRKLCCTISMSYDSVESYLFQPIKWDEACIYFPCYPLLHCLVIGQIHYSTLAHSRASIYTPSLLEMVMMHEKQTCLIDIVTKLCSFVLSMLYYSLEGLWFFLRLEYAKSFQYTHGTLTLFVYVVLFVL